MKQYCLKCGHPTEYSISKPNFCSKCGNPFNSTQKEAQEPKKLVIKDKIDIDIEEDYDGEDIKMPNIKALEIEEIIIPQEEKETLGSILRKNKSLDNPAPKRRKKTKISKKESKKILEDLLSEAKTSRHQK